MNAFSALSSLPAHMLPWYAQNARDLPWRRDRDPYHVLVSEIMLQQTRVEAVRSHYERFIRELPDFRALAAVSNERLHKLWEGLGYYRRADNLKKAALRIVEEFDGRFPTQYEQVLSLPGVGPYTAGAICSICFDAPTPAVDGNVLRVLSRLLADETPIDLPAARQNAQRLLAQIYPAQSCGAFTQSLMELGATVCVPNGAPACHVCPLAHLCRAKDMGRQCELPHKNGKKARRVEDVTAFVFSCGDHIALCKRDEKGLLAGLWQLPNVGGMLDEAQALAAAGAFGLCAEALLRRVDRTHLFTHVHWNMRCYFIRCAKQDGAFVWADDDALAHTYALPSAFGQFLPFAKGSQNK